MCSAWVCSLNRVSTDFGVFVRNYGNLRGQKRRQGGAASFSTWRWTHFCVIAFRPGTICGKLSYLCFLEKPRFVVNLWQDLEYTRVRIRRKDRRLSGSVGQMDKCCRSRRNIKLVSTIHTLACITHIGHYPSLSDNVTKIPGFIKILLISYEH